METFRKCLIFHSTKATEDDGTMTTFNYILENEISEEEQKKNVMQHLPVYID